MYARIRKKRMGEGETRVRQRQPGESSVLAFEDNRKAFRSRPALRPRSGTIIQKYDSYGDAFWSGLKDGLVLNLHNLSAGFFFKDEAKSIKKKHGAYGTAADVCSKVGTTAAWMASGAWLTRAGFSGAVANASRYGPSASASIIRLGSQATGAFAAGNIHLGAHLINRGDIEQGMDAVQSGILLLGPVPGVPQSPRLFRGTSPPVDVYETRETGIRNGQPFSQHETLVRQGESMVYGRRQSGFIRGCRVETELVAVRQGRSMTVKYSVTVNQGSQTSIRRISLNREIRLRQADPQGRLPLPLNAPPPALPAPVLPPVTQPETTFSNRSGTDSPSFRNPGEFSHFTPAEAEVILDAMGQLTDVVFASDLEPGMRAEFDVDISDVPGWPGFLEKQVCKIRVPRDMKRIEVTPEIWHLFHWKHYAAAWQAHYRRPVQYETWYQYKRHRELIEVLEKTFMTKLANTPGRTAYTPADQATIRQGLEGYFGDLRAAIRTALYPKRDYAGLFKDPRARLLLDASNPVPAPESLLGPAAVEQVLRDRPQAFTPEQRRGLTAVLEQMKTIKTAFEQGMSEQNAPAAVMPPHALENLAADIRAMEASGTLTTAEAAHLLTMIRLYRNVLGRAADLWEGSPRRH